MSKKLKVVWICHFSNALIRKKLPLWNELKISDFAPWITNLITEFEKIPEVEIHIISPYYGLQLLAFEYEHNGIFYHFFRPWLPSLPWIIRIVFNYFPLDLYIGQIKNRYLVRNLISKIKPDLINLHGAENNYYSATILGIRHIPIYISVQGIYSNPLRFNKHNRPDKLRIRTEREIHHQNKYFGVRAPFMTDLIERDALNPIFLWQTYPSSLPEISKNDVVSEYDFVFFARINHTKGIEEILEALAIVKKIKPEVSLNIIGPEHSWEYTDFLKRKVENLEIAENVTFTGALPCLTDVHKEVIKAKFSVLASKIDTIPATIIESILLGLPVVTTDTGGIPYLNKEEETILISKQGDIEAMANNMMRLLDDPELCDRLRTAATAFVEREFNSREITLNFIKQYKAIIAHYRDKQTIPRSLLFDKNIFA